LWWENDTRRERIVEDSTITEADKATFLADTYFPVYLYTKNSFDLGLSVGTGEGPSKDREIEKEFLNL